MTKRTLSPGNEGGGTPTPELSNPGGTVGAEQDHVAVESLIAALETESSTQQVVVSLRARRYGEAAGQLEVLGATLSDPERQSLAAALERTAYLPQSNLQKAAVNAAQALREGQKEAIANGLSALGDALRQHAARVEYQPPAAQPAGDTTAVMEALRQVFQTFQHQLQRDTAQTTQGQLSDPFPEGTPARTAAEEFRRIVAGLQFKGFPPGPLTLTATAVSQTEIDLTWTVGTNDVTGFTLRRCKGSGCTGVEKEIDLARSERKYRDSGLDKDTVYRYRLIAINTHGETISDFVGAKTHP